MKTNKTAIDWIIQQIDNKVIGDGDYRTLSDILEQAKAMEKEQIMSAYKSGCVGEMFELNINHSAEQYYEETYGTKKQDSEA